MNRLATWVLIAGILTILSGCAFDCENRASPRLTVDLSNLGTAEPVISPTNDARSWNGEPMDLRSKR